MNASERWRQRRERARVMNDLLAEADQQRPGRLDALDRIRAMKFGALGAAQQYAADGAEDMSIFCEGRVSALTDVLELLDPQ